MKQGVLAGRTAGLRPAQKRRLERLCHRRHPEDQVAELLCLQRLASESLELELPLTLVVDGRGPWSNRAGCWSASLDPTAARALT